MSGAKKLSPADFVHLHNHTHYSLLDGLSKIEPLIDTVKELGMDSVAITDHGTLSGVIDLYKTATHNNIKPIIGIETYVAPRTFKEKDPVKDKTPFHLILIALNNIGYQNLMRLSTIANLDGFYYRPRVDHDLLEKYNEGLIVLSGCIGGEVGDALRQGQYNQAKDIAVWYKKIFKDRYYLEVQDHGHIDHPSVWQEQVAVTEQTLRLAKELDIPAVLTCDAHYLKKSDQEAHEILLCVQTGSFLSDENRMSLKDFNLHLTDPKEIIKRWGKDNPELILNTSKIASICNVKIELGKILIPKFPVPNEETEQSYLERLVYQGLARRYGKKSQKEASRLSTENAKQTLSKEILARAKYELGVIDKMQFSGYFLIIADFVNWGKERGIVFGPGRGSAAGSIISYALRITEMDPIKYDLLFERFLNPDRISMPDIDIDIQDSRRDEVIRYCADKYGGNERVANIVTFGRMAARNAVRDVARVLQVPYANADRLAKMIPPPVQGRHVSLATSLENNRDLKNEYRTNEESKKVFKLAVQLENTIRSHGVHAAGVVIAPDEIVKFTPLEMAQKGVVATQYSMGPIEDLGLLKIDFLGLSNLTIIKNTLRIAKKVFGDDIDIEQIPLDDKKTFQLLASGDTTGVFQLESSGMKRYLKELKPTVFDDIVAMVALYRPGPMQWIEDFIARKHGLRDIEYLHKAMKPALSSTYGIIVYQEQVMQISKDMCGFSGGQADTLRKAIGKKKPEELAKLKNDFIEGAVKTVNADRKAMGRLWSQLEDFAAYCFNKSHAACYGLIAYQTAYLKAHYPSAFMAALMTSDFDNTDRLAIEINECKHMDIEVLPPDVNESFVEFAIVKNTNNIRFGMAAIKNVGTAAVEEILRARELKGNFKNLEDFLGKVNSRIVNRKTIESLIKSGAFDEFADRGLLHGNIEVLLAYASNAQKQRLSGQTDLFGSSESKNAFVQKLNFDDSLNEATDAEKMLWERELLGVYLSEHPLEKHKEYLAQHTTALNSIEPEHDGKNATVGGLITDVREIVTKNGQKMAFVKINDDHAEVELIIFPKLYKNTLPQWRRDEVVVVKGRVTAKDKAGNNASEIKILVESIKTLNGDNKVGSDGQVTLDGVQDNSSPARLYIKLENSQDNTTLTSLKKTIDEYHGETEVVLVLGERQKAQIIKLPIKIEHTKAMPDLEMLVGKENVRLR